LVWFAWEEWRGREEMCRWCGGEDGSDRKTRENVDRRNEMTVKEFQTKQVVPVSRRSIRESE
jgi:hypothetical protein